MWQHLYVSVALSQIPPYAARPRVVSALHGVSIYAVASARTYCSYLVRDGQTELISGWLVTQYTPTWLACLKTSIPVLTGPDVDQLH